MKTEIKGMEMKRSSSSKYEGEFQRQLVDLILDEKSKDEIKKHHGVSPDYADAIMMRMYDVLLPNYGKYSYVTT